MHQNRVIPKPSKNKCICEFLYSNNLWTYYDLVFIDFNMQFNATDWKPMLIHPPMRNTIFFYILNPKPLPNHEWMTKHIFIQTSV